MKPNLKVLTILVLSTALFLALSPVTAQDTTQGTYVCRGTLGDVTRSVDASEGALLQVVNYTVDAGVTVTINQNAGLVVCAQENITIHGTVSVDGKGGVGGMRGAPPGLAGAGCGNNGIGGGQPTGGNGGATGTLEEQASLLYQLGLQTIDLRGAGGGGGHDGTAITTGGGGGGGGSCFGVGGNAGNGGASVGIGQGSSGGAGGGFILFIAKNITLGNTSVLSARGNNAIPSTNNGGSGGGGSGGSIILNAGNITEATGNLLRVNGGNGGACQNGNGGGGGGLESPGTNGAGPANGGGCGGGGGGGQVVRRTPAAVASVGIDVDDVDVLSTGLELDGTSTLNILVLLLMCALGAWVWKGSTTMQGRLFASLFPFVAMVAALGQIGLWDGMVFLVLFTGGFTGLLMLTAVFKEVERRREGKEAF